MFHAEGSDLLAEEPDDKDKQARSTSFRPCIFEAILRHVPNLQLDSLWLLCHTKKHSARTFVEQATLMALQELADINLRSFNVFFVPSVVHEEPFHILPSHII